ncbi:MAG: hypothetical protein KF886_16450 [Candidatus Hydrogenedentes bacterium]|nr:hypothetical protein [Candidatus Hydrogenedentota bacterium]
MTEALRRPATRRQWWAGCVAVAVCAVVIFSFNVPRTGFHGDEAGWIPASLRAAEAFLAGDFRPSSWTGEGLSTYGNMNPPAGKLMIGVPLILWQRAFYPAESGAAVYHWNQSIENNIIHGRVPPLPLLYAARSICAFYGALNCVLVFVMATWALRFEIGLIAAALTMLNGTFLNLATNAMTDMPYLLALLCAGLALMALLEARKPRRVLSLALLCGVCAAIAYSIKVAGLVLIGALFLAAMVLRPRATAPGMRWRVAAVAVFGAAAVLLPLLMNPFFWPDPARWDGAALREEIQRVRTPGAGEELPGWGEIWAELAVAGHARPLVSAHYPQIANLLKPLEMPLLFFRWKTLMRNQARTIVGEDKGPPGIPEILNRVAWSLATFPGAALFLLAGLGALVFRAVHGWAREPGSAAIYPLLAFLVNLLFLMLFLVLPWPRYYLAAIVASNILVAVGLFLAGGLVRGKARAVYTFFREALLEPAAAPGEP